MRNTLGHSVVPIDERRRSCAASRLLAFRALGRLSAKGRLSMKKLFVGWALLSAALFVAGVSPARGQDISTDTDDDSPLTSCDQVHIHFDHHSPARDEQDFTIPKSQAPRLEARPSENGGIQVLGWDRDEYQIKACKAAENSADLKSISVSVNGGRVEVKGPSHEK